MIVEAQVTIDGSRDAIWTAITDIARASDIISGIDRIEVVERPPAPGLVGLKWRETRTLFGKAPTVDKTITEAAEGEFYSTRAESDGCVFTSTTRISAGNGALTLTSAHVTTPQRTGPRIMLMAMGFLFKGVAKKALLQDLNDVKSAVEKGE